MESSSSPPNQPTQTTSRSEYSELRTESDLPPLSEFALLLFGKPFVRKSTLCLHFPFPLFFDCDGKIGNLRPWYPNRKFHYVSPLVGPNGEPVPLKEQWPRFVQLFKKYAMADEYKTLVIDSVTRLSEMLIAFLMENEPEGKKPMRGGIRTMSMQLWYPYKEQLQNVIAALRASGKASIVTVHERYYYNKEGNVIDTGPTVSGQLSDILPKDFTDSWQCDVRMTVPDEKHPDGIQYFVRTEPTSKLSTLGHSYPLPAEFEQDWSIIAKGYPHLAKL